MNRSQRAKLLHGLGCLFVIIGAITLTILAFAVQLRYFFGAIALITIYTLLLWQNTKADQRLFTSAFDRAFKSFQKTRPTLQISNSHGFPCFTIMFQSESDLNQAEADGHLNTFRSEIAELCGDSGWKENPFDVDRAVSATWVGRRYFVT